jgi:hypothetical protein
MDATKFDKLPKCLFLRLKWNSYRNYAKQLKTKTHLSLSNVIYLVTREPLITQIGSTVEVNRRNDLHVR